MKREHGTERAVVLGRQIFVDLWALLGFEPVVCEFPRDLPGCYTRFLGDEVAFVIVEKDWFEQTPEQYRKMLEMRKKPSWIIFPNIEPGME